MSLRSISYTALYNNGHIVDDKPFTLLFAADKDCVIGDSTTDGMPWRCKPDLARFKQLTMGNVVVLGAKTYLALVKSWPAKHVLPGRDVVVVFGVETDDYLEIEESRAKLMNAYQACNKQVGERLVMFPAPRDLMKHDANQRILFRYQEELSGDIKGFARPGQTVYIAGGVALIELMFETCRWVQYTLIHHSTHNHGRVYLGSKAHDLVKSIELKHKDKLWDAVDDEAKTKASFYHMMIA
jgi:dihydrofolate reductase